jgi:L-ribulose-5-phosphate 3-epimerase
MDNILAVSTNTYHTHSFDEALAGIAKAGFKYVEIASVEGWTDHVPVDASDAQLAEAKAQLARWGLKVSAISGHSDLTTEHGLVMGKKAVNLCEKMSVPILNTAIGGHYSENENKDAFMAHIHELADYADKRGIVVSLEVHGDIMASGALSIKIIKEINCSNVKINYDTGNCKFYGGEDAVDDIGPTIPYLAHVHLKDKIGGPRVWNFPGVGEGEVDFGRVLKILDEGGYRGPFGVEVEFSGDPFPPVAEVDRAVKVSYDTLKKLGLS